MPPSKNTFREDDTELSPTLQRVLDELETLPAGSFYCVTVHTNDEKRDLVVIHNLETDQEIYLALRDIAENFKSDA